MFYLHTSLFKIKNAQFLLFYLSGVVSYSNGLGMNQLEQDVPNHTFNKRIYEDVLNPELCQRHLSLIMKNSSRLQFRFYDAGIRIPRGIFLGNTLDLGNYHQCLNINEAVEDVIIQGKYCMLKVPANQSLQIPNFPTSNLFNFEQTMLHLDKVKLPGAETRVGFESPIANINFRLAVCIPASCTTREALSAFYFNISDAGFVYEEEFCRLPNDKPWVSADYVAILIFSIIGLFVIVSTCYDLRYSFILRKGYNILRKSELFCCSFSAYTNTRRLFTFKSGPESLDCIYGIRALAMMWVIIGHVLIAMFFSINLFEAFQWATSIKAIWVTAAPITVDTFFMLSGLLVVYTTAGKLNSMQLLKNILLFYLNRLLRMFPILAAMILYMVSFHNRIFDGPLSETPAMGVLTCKQYWWSALLHIQNFYNPKTCLLEIERYHVYYYINTLTRSSPFFVGMVNGYILHLWKGKPLLIPKYLVLSVWGCVVLLLLGVMYCVRLNLEVDWENQLADNIFNSFMRPAWALGLGWLIFACVKGYGGPLNWFLSLDMWKLPARLSYAMYIIHFPIIMAVYSSSNIQSFFSVSKLIFNVAAFLFIMTITAFVVTIAIDAPFATLMKLVLSKDNFERKSKKEKPKKLAKEDGKSEQNEIEHEADGSSRELETA